MYAVTDALLQTLEPARKYSIDKRAAGRSRAPVKRGQ